MSSITNEPNELRSQYVLLAKEYLDNIPIERPQDYKIAAEALRSITDHTHKHYVPPSLKERVSSIKELIDCPDLYVEEERNYPAFIETIKGCIAAKIDRFEELSSSSGEQMSYIREQQEQREAAKKYQKTVSEKKPPAEGSPSHTISEHEWLRLLQERFQREGDSQANGSQHPSAEIPYSNPFYIDGLRLPDPNSSDDELHRLRDRLQELFPSNPSFVDEAHRPLDHQAQVNFGEVIEDPTPHVEMVVETVEETPVESGPSTPSLPQPEPMASGPSSGEIPPGESAASPPPPNGQLRTYFVPSSQDSGFYDEIDLPFPPPNAVASIAINGNPGDIEIHDPDRYSHFLGSLEMEEVD